MTTAAIIGLMAGQCYLSSGVLSGAELGVLRQVADRRIAAGWGLGPTEFAHYDALIATPDCDRLGNSGTLTVDGTAYRVLVVDCAQPHHRVEMEAAGLLADVNRRELWHKQGELVLYGND